MSRLTDLIAQAKAKDPQLGADLDREFKQLSSRLPFWLKFERLRPEAVKLIIVVMFWMGTTDTRWFEFLAPRPDRLPGDRQPRVL